MNNGLFIATEMKNMSISRFVDPKAARKARKEYSAVLRRIAQSDHCPFCVEHIKTWHTNPITHAKYWMITDNRFPYTKGKQHTLFILKRHVVRLEELTKKEWVELAMLTVKDLTVHKVENGGFFAKFGDTASIHHLHFHIVQDTRISKEVL